MAQSSKRVEPPQNPGRFSLPATRGRSVKYERVDLKAYDSVSAARAEIADYLAWYNAYRPHSSLDRSTPDEAYFAGLMPVKLAA